MTMLRLLRKNECSAGTYRNQPVNRRRASDKIFCATVPCKKILVNSVCCIRTTPNYIYFMVPCARVRDKKSIFIFGADLPLLRCSAFLATFSSGQNDNNKFTGNVVGLLSGPLWGSLSISRMMFYSGQAVYTTYKA